VPDKELNVESSGELDREDEEDDREEGHIDDHLFLHNANLASVQSYAPVHESVRDNIVQNNLINSNMEV